jgi:hypothetical protein
VTRQFEIRDRANGAIIRGPVSRIIDYLNWVVLPAPLAGQRPAAEVAIDHLRQDAFTYAHDALKSINIELIEVVALTEEDPHV